MISEAPNVHRLLRHVCEGDAKGKYVERGNRDHICKQSISYGMYCNIFGYADHGIVHYRIMVAYYRRLICFIS